MSLLVILIFNTLTADEKYSLGKRENLPQLSQTPLYKKLKAFSYFVIAFLKSTSNFENFGKKRSAS